jgi:hypothetical protein
MGVERFRKRPVEIEAQRLTTDNQDEIAGWCGGRLSHATRYGKPIGGVLIDTLEGAMGACVGDWIIRGVQGEFYPCKPDIFEKTYERVSP